MEGLRILPAVGIPIDRRLGWVSGSLGWREATQSWRELAWLRELCRRFVMVPAR